MFRYETHLHTWPVSACARFNVRDNLEFYKKTGYDGVFITNHFLDGNICLDVRQKPYEEQINFYFTDYEEGLKIGEELGIKVFFGVELSYLGTDFLIYGLSKEWFLTHPEIMEMKKSEELSFLMSEGALVIQAHPYRERGYIDHLRLFPRCVHGAEVINACETDLSNDMAKVYAESYGLLKTAGSDNHWGSEKKTLAGMSSETPLRDEADFIDRVKNNKMELFTLEVK